MSTENKQPRLPTAPLPNDQDGGPVSDATVIGTTDVPSTSQPQQADISEEQSVESDDDDDEDDDSSDDGDDDGEGFRLRGPVEQRVARPSKNLEKKTKEDKLKADSKNKEDSKKDPNVDQTLAKKKQ